MYIYIYGYIYIYMDIYIYIYIISGVHIPVKQLMPGGGGVTIVTGCYYSN